MSRYGARGFALRGRSFRWILAHYYRGTRLTTLPKRTRVRVLVADRPSAVIGAATRLVVTYGRGRCFHAVPDASTSTRTRGARSTAASPRRRPRPMRRSARPPAGRSSGGAGLRRPFTTRAPGPNCADGIPGARAAPYPRSVRDPYDRTSPRHRWSRRVGTGHLAAVAGLGDVSTVRTLINGSGRVRYVWLAGGGPADQRQRARPRSGFPRRGSGSSPARLRWRRADQLRIASAVGAAQPAIRRSTASCQSTEGSSASRVARASS